MRKKVISIILLVLILLIPFFSWLFWAIQDSKELKVLIVDKTVLNKSTQEHMSLNWVLKNNKFKKAGMVNYDHQKDYYGFFPDEKGGYEIDDFNYYNDRQIDSMANYYDMLYYTDLYGIYVAEWWDAYPEVAPEDYSKVPPTERSRLIYGRLTKTELDLMKEMKERKKLIITEFNIIALPTKKNIRKDFEEEFGINWSGWIGRFFNVLDTTKKNELPLWLKRNYVNQYGEWPFTKSGIAFVREDDKIVIAEFETDLKIEVPFIHTPEKYMDEYDLPAEMKYSFWFEMVTVDYPNIVLANYHITPNERGDSLLRVNDLPLIFPAVIKGNGTYPFYYFAGDFCDNPIGINSASFTKLQWVSSFTYNSTADERKSFFWHYYRPLTDKIINDYYQSLNEKR